MNGFHTQALEGLGGEPRVLWGSFAPNAASNPLVASNGGPPGVKAFTTVYAATGQFTVTLPVGCTPVGTATVLVSAQCQDLTEYFEVVSIGAYNATTRSFVVQAKRAGTGREVAANAGARIHFALLFNNSTGG
jgi:hypothetical protein